MASHLSSVPVARHFIEFVSQNARASGPVIRTTLDLDLQTELEDSIARLLAGRAYEDPKLTAAFVAIDVKTGDVLAMAGSRDYFDDAIAGQVNAAVALRQPGSTLKPFTYFAAFAKGYTPNSVVSDEPLAFSAPGVEESEAYAPQNFDRRYHGEITIREALANSYNIPAVATLNEVGLSSYHDLLKRFGFTTFERPPMHYGLAVTLGSGEVTLLELTNAYAALARGGAYLPYRIIREETADGQPVPQTIMPRAERYAAQVTDILSDPDARLKSFGFNEAMRIDGHDVAVKTGTSYEYRDNWTVGYTPSYAIGVWVGHADGSPMVPSDGSAPTTGSSGAAPLWHAAMENVLRGKAAEKFPHSIDPGWLRLGTRDVAPTPLKSAKPWKIARPLPNMTFRVHPYLPIEHQKIAASAKVGAVHELPLRWYLDDRFIAMTRGDARLWIAPEPGRHRLRAQAEDGSLEEIAFRVVDGRD